MNSSHNTITTTNSTPYPSPAFQVVNTNIKQSSIQESAEDAQNRRKLPSCSLPAKVVEKSE